MITNDYYDIADENPDLTSVRKLQQKKITRMTRISNIRYLKVYNNLKKSNSNPFIQKVIHKPRINKIYKRNILIKDSNYVNKYVTNTTNDDAFNKISSSNCEIPTKIHDINKLPSQAVFNDFTLKLESFDQANVKKRRHKSGNKFKGKKRYNTNFYRNYNANNSKKNNLTYDSKKINITYLFKKDIPKKNLKKHYLVPSYSIKNMPPSRNLDQKTDTLQKSKDIITQRCANSENHCDNRNNKNRGNLQLINNNQIENNKLIITKNLYQNKINLKTIDNFLSRAKLTKYKINTPFQTTSNISIYSIKKLQKDKIYSSKGVPNNNCRNKEKRENISKSVDNFYNNIRLKEKSKILPDNNINLENNYKLDDLNKIKAKTTKNSNIKKIKMKKQFSKKYNCIKKKNKQISGIFLFTNTNARNITKQKYFTSKKNKNFETSNRLAVTTRQFENTIKKERQIKLKEISTIKSQIQKNNMRTSPKTEKNQTLNPKKKCKSNANFFSNFGTKNDKFSFNLEKLKKINTLNDTSCLYFRKKININQTCNKIHKKNKNLDITYNKRDHKLKYDISTIVSKYNKFVKLPRKTIKIKTNEILLNH